MKPMTLEEAVELECAIEAIQDEIKELERSLNHCKHCECSQTVHKVSKLKNLINMMTQRLGESHMAEALGAI